MKSYPFKVNDLLGGLIFSRKDGENSFTIKGRFEIVKYLC